MAAEKGDRAYLVGVALAAAASGFAVAAVGWAFDALHWAEFLIGVAIALAVGFVVATPWAADMRALIARARAIGADELEAQPTARRTPIGADLARALIETRRRVNGIQRALEERSRTSEGVLDAAPEPLIVIDLRQGVRHANRAAEHAFGGPLIGRSLVDVIRSPGVLDAAEAVVSGASAEETVDFSMSDGPGRSYRAIIGRLERIGGGGEAAVIALQDLTAIRRVEAMRADFVANASHELRTPLASLVGFIETLEGPAKDDPAARARFLAIMREQASRMTRVVEDLLSLSKIEMDEHAPPGRTDDVAGLLTAVVEQMGPIAAARGVRIGLTTPDATFAAAGEPDLLEQVFRNLLENAVKYGREGGEVRIEAAVVDGQARIRFADDGEGIRAEHIPRLTERFYRVDVARSRTLGGTGLGLAIVKHILIRCRGRLSIESAIGKGSVFTVWLPPPLD